MSRTRVAAVYADHCEHLTTPFAHCSPEEPATLTDWFIRATALAHEYLEKLNRNAPDEKC